MLFKYMMPTKVYFGRGCLEGNWAEGAGLGSRFFLVTGASSGKLSGALDDFISLLKKDKLPFEVYDNIENNPSLENIAEASMMARRANADVIVGIGGGSPLDAAKAVAVLAVNDMEPSELFRNCFPAEPLPIIAIPTTSGTGSEVTPYSVLTRHDMKTKVSFGNEKTFPKIAYLDPSYTESLPASVTIDTAVDAFSHAVEGYLSKRSTPLSDIYAIESMAAFGKCLRYLLNEEFPGNARDLLLYMSMLAGMVIAQTGTTIVHGLGYPLTYFKNIPHGKANGLFMEQYLRFNYPVCEEKIKNILEATGINSLEEFGVLFKKLTNTTVSLSEDEIDLYAGMTYEKKSTHFNPAKVEEEDLKRILRAVAGGENPD